MPTATYDLLDSSVLSSTATGIIFSSISQGYRDYKIIFTIPGDATGRQVYLRLNNDSSGTYNTVSIIGDGGYGSGSPSSDFDSRAGSAYLGWPRSFKDETFIQLDLLDATSTSQNKQILSKFGGLTNVVGGQIIRYDSNNAINQIELFTTSTAFPIGTAMYLYGIVS